MTGTLFEGRDLRAEVESFIHFSPWQAEVPSVPSTPVGEWGTLAWARLALALLEALDG